MVLVPASTSPARIPYNQRFHPKPTRFLPVCISGGTKSCTMQQKVAEFAFLLPSCPSPPSARCSPDPAQPQIASRPLCSLLVAAWRLREGCVGQEMVQSQGLPSSWVGRIRPPALVSISRAALGTGWRGGEGQGRSLSRELHAGVWHCCWLCWAEDKERMPVPRVAGTALKSLESLTKRGEKIYQSEHQNRLIARDEGAAQRLDCSITAPLLTAQNN